MLNINEVRRIVVKVGTSTLTYDNGRLNIRRIERLVRTISDLQNRGFEMVLVSSGAVTVGAAKMGLAERPRELAMKQAAAAVGQCELMHIYDKMFLEYGINVAQILLTRENIIDDDQRENIHNTFTSLMRTGAVPIVNENDTVATAELKHIENFGDNDTLSAVVARMCGADLLVIFSDIDGLYDSDPRKNPQARLIGHVSKIDAKIRRMAGGAGSAHGTGGMATKVEGAKLAAGAGVSVVICRSHEPDVIAKAIAGTAKGTYFKAGSGMKTRLQWMAFYAPTRGNVYIDSGAAEALCGRGRSLLPAGVRAVEGDFAAGDVVKVYKSGTDICLGRGTVNYSAAELREIMGLTSAAAAARYPDRPAEVIHQDNYAHMEQEVSE